MFKFKHNMVFKTITIKESVYKELIKVKKKDESFSDFLEELVISRKPDLLKYVGAWKNIPVEDIERSRKEFRNKFNTEFRKRLSLN